jgi:hypothetical protein
MGALKDIFGYKRNGKARGVFSSDNSFLTFGDPSGDKVSGYLVQTWNIGYTQQVNEVFEIGSQNLYWMKGRPTGQGAIGRIVGEKGADSKQFGLFPTSAYDLCDGGAMMRITAIGGHCDQPPVHGQGVVLNKGVSLIMDGCVVISVGFGMSVADLRITENYGWRFAYLEVA